jgi:SgrR family transcriptional regulator
MKRAEHYVKLRDRYPQIREGEGFAITLDELSAILDCTRQNVRLVLKQFVSEGWIRWTSGQGRGCYSELTFLRSAERVVYDVSLERATRGDMTGAFTQMNLLSPHLKAQFLEQLSAQFGFQEETNAEQQLDILRNVTFVPFHNLDPARLYFAREFNLSTQIFDNLVKVNPATGAIEPHLAHSWEVDESARVWTFYLRKGVLFHHGREMNAQDVVDTLRRFSDPHTSSYRWLVDGIESMQILKKTVVQITLRESNELFLHFLAAPPAAIVPLDVAATRAERFRLLPVGTGPFQVVQNDQQQLVMEANKHYFQGRPFWDRVEYWVVPRDSLTTQDVAKMGVHLNHDQQEKPADWQEKTLLKKFVQYLSCNLIKEGPLQDVRMRKALDLALDRSRMIAELGGIRARVADGFLGKRERGGEAPSDVVNGEDVTATHQTEARALLAEMGYRGEPLKLYTFMRDENVQDARWIQARCADVGISIEVSFIRASEMQQLYQEADLILKLDMIDEHVEFSFFKVFCSDNSLLKNCLREDLSHFIQGNLNHMVQERDVATRIGLMEQIEEQLRWEAAVLFLYQEEYVAIYQPHIQGISQFSTGLIDLKSVWFRR